MTPIGRCPHLDRVHSEAAAAVPRACVVPDAAPEGEPATRARPRHWSDDTHRDGEVDAVRDNKPGPGRIRIGNLAHPPQVAMPLRADKADHSPGDTAQPTRGFADCIRREPAWGRIGAGPVSNGRVSGPTEYSRALLGYARWLGADTAAANGTTPGRAGQTWAWFCARSQPRTLLSFLLRIERAAIRCGQRHNLPSQRATIRITEHKSEDRLEDFDAHVLRFQRLADALKSLSDVERAVLVCRYDLGLTHVGTADMLGLPTSKAAATATHGARESLRRHLDLGDRGSG